jgi:hypothetical protein
MIKGVYLVFNPFVNDDVKHIFSNYPKDVKPKLLFLRELIFDTAKQTKGVGEIVMFSNDQYVHALSP